MNTWSPVFSSIVDSSIWMEPYHVRVLWITLLSLKDSDHCVYHSPFGLSRRANMTEQEVFEALKVLSSPDKIRYEGQKYEGRRIEAIEGGWKILNGQKYEDMMRKINRRVYNARKQREYYAAKKNSPGATLKEKKFEEHYGDGDQAKADSFLREGV